MHEEHVDVVDVVDEEGFVARGHHVAGLLVGTVTDLRKKGGLACLLLTSYFLLLASLFDVVMLSLTCGNLMCCAFLSDRCWG